MGTGVRPSPVSTLRAHRRGPLLEYGRACRAAGPAWTRRRVGRRRPPSARSPSRRRRGIGLCRPSSPELAETSRPMRSLYRGRRWRVLQLALLPGSSAREAKPNAVQCDPGPPTDGSLLAGTTRSARALDLALVAPPPPSSGSACARSRGARHRGGRRVTLFSSSSRFVANNVVHGVWDRRVYVGPSGPAPRCRHPNGFAAGHTASTLPFCNLRLSFGPASRCSSTGRVFGRAAFWPTTCRRDCGDGSPRVG